MGPWRMNIRGNNTGLITSIEIDKTWASAACTGDAHNFRHTKVITRIFKEQELDECRCEKKRQCIHKLMFLIKLLNPPYKKVGGGKKKMNKTKERTSWL